MIRLLRALSLTIVMAGCATLEAPTPSIVLAGPAIVRNSPTSGPEVQAAGYVRLQNNSDRPDRLVSLSCTCAEDVQMHSTFDRAMHVLPHMDIPARGELEVIPGGPTHLMLMGVKAPIAPGESVRITLTFEQAGPFEFDFVAVENSREGWAARDTR